MASAIVHMFNIPISIVSPEMPTVDLFHNVTPQIMIIANGGSSVSRKPTTHFSPDTLYHQVNWWGNG